MIDPGLCHVQDNDIDFQFSSNIWCKFYWILKHSNMVVHPAHISAAVKTALRHMNGLKERPEPLDITLSQRFAIT